MTTLATFTAAVAALAPTGVVRKYDYQPVAINDLPAQFVRLPSSGYNQGSASSTNYDGKSRAVELVVCLEAVGQNNPEPNFDATVAMIDAVEAVIDAANLMPIVTYDITSGAVQVGEIVYWAVTARITGEK